MTAVPERKENTVPQAGKTCPLHFSMQLRLSKELTFFGPGVAQLLTLVEETGSLNSAAGRMGMAYSKAWKIIKKAEQQLGFPLLTRTIGGKSGGGSSLTEECKSFLERYLTLQKAANEVTDGLFRELFSTYF